VSPVLMANGQSAGSSLRAHLAAVVIGAQIALHEKHGFAWLLERGNFGVVTDGAVHPVRIVSCVIAVASP